MALGPPTPQKGVTPLSSAARGGHVDVVRLLLKKGANKDAADMVGGAWGAAGCRG